MKPYVRVEKIACSLNVRGAEIKRAADKGAKHKEIGFYEKRKLPSAILNEASHRKRTDRSTKGKAVNAPTEGDESLDKNSIWIRKFLFSIEFAMRLSLEVFNTLRTGDADLRF
jgi:hypothetical protein